MMKEDNCTCNYSTQKGRTGFKRQFKTNCPVHYQGF